MLYFSIIKGFLTSKLGLYIISIILILAGCFLGYKYIFNQGYNKAKEEASIEYTKQLNEALIIQSTKQQEAIKKAVETANKDKDIEIKWKEKKVFIDKIVEKTIYKECEMPIEDRKVFTEAWDSIK